MSLDYKDKITGFRLKSSDLENMFVHVTATRILGATVLVYRLSLVSKWTYLQRLQEPVKLRSRLACIDSAWQRSAW